MIETFEKLFWFLVLSSAQLAVLGLIAVLVCKSLKPQGIAAHWIWAVVVVFPLVSPVSYILPAQFQLALPSFETHSGSTTAVIPDLTSVSEDTSATDRSFWERQAELPVFYRESVTENTLGVPDSGSALDTSGSPATPPQHVKVTAVTYGWGAIFLLFWAFVVVLLSLKLLWDYSLLRQKISGYACIDDPSIHALCVVCAREVGLNRTPRLAVTDGPAIPFVIGIFRPTIVLPRHLLDEEHREGLRFALLHEMAHLFRRDSWWLPVELLMSTLYFFHPAVHWAARKLREEREFLCDRFVIQLTNNRASYADFLLSETWNNSNENRKLFALPFGAKTPSVSRRVKEIVSGKGDTMPARLRNGIAMSVLLCLIAPLIALSASVLSDDGSDYCFAEPSVTNEQGVFYVLPAFDSVKCVKIIKRYGPYGDSFSRFIDPDTDYDYDQATGRMQIKVPVDMKDNRVVVTGKQSIPWVYRIQKPIRKGSVKVYINDRICEEGADFTVEPEAGIVRISKDLCVPEHFRCIRYRYDQDYKWPRNYSQNRTGYLGQEMPFRGDFDLYKVFMGFPAGVDWHGEGSIGTNALPSWDDPNVYNLGNLMDEDTICVGILSHDYVGDIKWLEKGVDYIYDRERGKIHFISDKKPDYDKGENIFIHGVPDPNIAFLHEPPRPGNLTIKFCGELLREGEDGDYIVNYETGMITYFTPEKSPLQIGYCANIQHDNEGRLTELIVSKCDEDRNSRGYADAEDYDPDINQHKVFGTSGILTSDTHVFGLTLPMQTKGLLVAVAPKNRSDGEMKWLKRDEDYAYDEQEAKITLLTDIKIDPETEYLFVSGVPHEDIFMFRRALYPGEVKVVINGRELIEGSDYVVNYSSGNVMILDSEILEPDAKYSISAGDDVYSNEEGELQVSAFAMESGGGASGYQPDIGYNSVGTNATPTNTPGLYVLSQPMEAEKGMGVGIATRKTSGNVKWLKENEQYTYDEEKGLIQLLDGIGPNRDRGEYLFVMGDPYDNVFLTHGPLQIGDVTGTINGRQIVEGENVIVDYETGRITLTDPDAQRRDAKIDLHAANHTFTQNSDEYRGRGFADSDDYDPEIDMYKTIGTNASPTDDPKLYVLQRRMQTKGLILAIANKNTPGDLKWLKRDWDYSYDESLGEIHFLRDIQYDKENEYIFVHGVPNPNNIFYYRRPLAPGSVSVVIEGRSLTEGAGFTVDYEKGIVTVLDPELDKLHVSFHISVDGADGVGSSMSTGTYTKTGTSTMSSSSYGN